VLERCILSSNVTALGGQALDGVAGNGGAGACICSSGMLTMSSCTMTNNGTGRGGTGYYGGSGGSGGAIFSTGFLTVNNSLLADNSAGHAGDSLWTTGFSGGGRGGSGGGIYNGNTLAMTNSTLSGNQAGNGSLVRPEGTGFGATVAVVAESLVEVRF